MLEYWEFAKQLEGLIRRRENFGKDRNDILTELSLMADNYKTVANYMEQNMQRDLSDELNNS